MLFVCIMLIHFLALTNANDFCSHSLSLGYSHSLCVYLECYFASYAVPFISWFSYFYVNTVFLMKGLCALWRNST